MSQPINGSLLRAKQFVPQFGGTAPDAQVSQAHALIAIGELLQLILMQLQSQHQDAQRLAQKTADAQPSRRPTRAREILDQF